MARVNKIMVFGFFPAPWSLASPYRAPTPPPDQIKVMSLPIGPLEVSQAYIKMLEMIFPQEGSGGERYRAWGIRGALYVPRPVADQHKRRLPIL